MSNVKRGLAGLVPEAAGPDPAGDGLGPQRAPRGPTIADFGEGARGHIMGRIFPAIAPAGPCREFIFEIRNPTTAPAAAPLGLPWGPDKSEKILYIRHFAY